MRDSKSGNKKLRDSRLDEEVNINLLFDENALLIKLNTALSHNSSDITASIPSMQIRSIFSNDSRISVP